MDQIAGSLADKGTPAEHQIWRALSGALDNYHGLMGYRLPSAGENESARVPSFIIVSSNHGIVLINVVDTEVVGFAQDTDYFLHFDQATSYRSDIMLDDFHNRVVFRFQESKILYNRRSKSSTIPITKILILYDTPASVAKNLPDEQVFADHIIYRGQPDQDILAYLSSMTTTIDENATDQAIAILEGTTAFARRSDSPKPQIPRTKQDFISLSSDYIFKLDQTQRQIALQIPGGMQRIRGLAGTGKTVILSLKAALAHKEFPNFKILFLFNTQSMYPQIKKRISQYFIREVGEEPDWNSIKVFHAWGGRDQQGLYSYLCEKYGIARLTYGDVKGASSPLSAIYTSLLKMALNRLQPEFDLVLIDEAQDLPPPLFETVFHLTKDPKRIIWAYDEFQSLTEASMPEPSQLFGTMNGTANAHDNVLTGEYVGGVEKDFILPNSYRNPRLALMTAHGIALGLKRTGGLIEAFESRRDWEALGYRVIQPNGKTHFAESDIIELERPIENSKNLLEELLRRYDHHEDELLTFSNEFASKEEEFEHVSREIQKLIRDEGIEPEEIIVVTLDPIRSKRELGLLRRKLDEKGIKAISPGIVEGPALFQEKGFVTLATPFRAKGNEANVTFVVSVELVVNDVTFRMRNAAFVALTRSRGWTHMSGLGQSTTALKNEVDRLLKDYPRVSFPFPSRADLERRRSILRADDLKMQQLSEMMSDLSKNPELIIEAAKTNPELLEKLRAGLRDSE